MLLGEVIDAFLPAQMVWEQNVNVVVMLTTLADMGMVSLVCVCCAHCVGAGDYVYLTCRVSPVGTGPPVESPHIGTLRYEV